MSNIKSAEKGISLDVLNPLFEAAPAKRLASDIARIAIWAPDTRSVARITEIRPADTIRDNAGMMDAGDITRPTFYNISLGQLTRWGGMIMITNQWLAESGQPMAYRREGQDYMQFFPDEETKLTPNELFKLHDKRLQQWGIEPASLNGHYEVLKPNISTAEGLAELVRTALPESTES